MKLQLSQGPRKFSSDKGGSHVLFVLLLTDTGDSLLGAHLVFIDLIDEDTVLVNASFNASGLDLVELT